jgi:hypothetical protein
MKSAFVVFPALNCDRDAATAPEQLTGNKMHFAKIFPIVAAFSILSFAANADDAASSTPAPAKAPCMINGAPVDAATLDAALDLQKATGTQERMESTVDLVLPAMLQMLKQTNADISQSTLNAFTDAFRAEMKASIPEVLNETACIAARHYTLSEIQQIRAFYATDIGQKMLKETPELMKESMAVGMAWGREAGKAAAERALAHLRSNGVKI